MHDAWIDDVYRFWFETLPPAAWFHADPATDEVIRRRFIGLYQLLKAAPPVAASPRQAVAGVVVFDQFPRNMFRRTPLAYASDPLAVSLAQSAVAAGFDRQLYTTEERQFLYMPFLHSEDRALQQRSIELFAGYCGSEPARFAEDHKAIVDRFGRFPHRNAILGRASTPEEVEYLKTAPSFV